MSNMCIPFHFIVLWFVTCYDLILLKTKSSNHAIVCDWYLYWFLWFCRRYRSIHRSTCQSTFLRMGLTRHIHFQYGLVVVLELRRCRRIGPPSIRCVATAVAAVVMNLYVVLWSLLSLLLSIGSDSNMDVFDTSDGNDDIVLIRQVSFFHSQIGAFSPAVQLVVGVTGHQARTIPWWPPIKHLMEFPGRIWTRHITSKYTRIPFLIPRT